MPFTTAYAHGLQAPLAFTLALTGAYTGVVWPVPHVLSLSSQMTHR